MGPTRNATGAALALGLAACGPASSVGAPVDCDESEEVRLLELDDNELVRPYLPTAVRRSDGWVFQVTELDRDVRDVYRIDAEPKGVQREYRVVAVDRCGGSRRTIADGLHLAGTQLSGPAPRDDLPLVGVDAASERVYVLDPSGDRPPWLVEAFDARSLRYVRDGFAGLVGDGELVYVRDRAEGEPIVEVLMTGVRDVPATTPIPGVVDALVVVTEARELVKVDVRDGSTSVVRQGVDIASRLGRGGRFAVIADYEPPVGFHALVDIEAGTGIPLGRDGAGGSGHWSEDFVARYDLAGDETQFVFLPGLREVWLEGQWSAHGSGMLPDGGRLIEGPDGLYRLPPDSDEPEFLAPGSGWTRVIGDTIYSWEYEPGPPQPPLLRTRHRLSRMAADGSDPTDLLGGPVHGSLALPDGTWAVVQEIDDRGYGDIVLVDPSTGDRRTIARDVWADFAYWNWFRDIAPQPASPFPDVQDDLLYMVWGPERGNAMIRTPVPAG